MKGGLPKSALALLAALADARNDRASLRRAPSRLRDDAADWLVANDLARRGPEGLTITAAGRARLARAAADGTAVGPFRAQHLSLGRRLIATPEGWVDVAVDDAESPLAWLARRKGRDGKPLIAAVQLQ